MKGLIYYWRLKTCCGFLHVRTHARTHARTQTVPWVTAQFARLLEAKVGRGKCDSRHCPSSGGNYDDYYSLYDRMTAVCHSICPSLPSDQPPQQPSEGLVSDCSLSCGDSSALNELKGQDVDTCIQAEFMHAWLYS